MSEDICRHLEMSPRLIRLCTRERFEAEQCLFWLERHMPVENSVLYNKLSGIDVEPILYMIAATKMEKVKRALSHYYNKLKNVTLSLSGKDLVRMGIPPGPVYREIFQVVLNAKLNGQINTESDEFTLAQKYVS
jgi:tRNA nucleotidyltransferase (CCA-adding enzyme)